MEGYDPVVAYDANGVAYFCNIEDIGTAICPVNLAIAPIVALWRSADNGATWVDRKYPVTPD
ncbi:MAG: hypothetical protein WBL19_02870, partial [Minisyncoccia bacterium]